ncbi:MAG: hypothetical protein Kow0042_11600 [Calditrichia bacterium]
MKGNKLNDHQHLKKGKNALSSVRVSDEIYIRDFFGEMGGKPNLSDMKYD